MLKKFAWLALLPVILLSSVLRLTANEVTLKNGDRLSGKIIEETEEAVVIETAYAGKVTIDRKHIEKIADPSAAPVAAEPAEARSETAKAKPKAEEAKPEPKAAVAAFRKPERIFSGGFRGLAEGWEGNANVGFSVTSGNSNNTTMATGLRAVKNGGPDKLTVYARSVWNSDRGNGHMVTTQNAFWGGVRYDRNLDGRQFGFVSYDFERDRPRGLNMRSVAGAGLGRHVVKSETSEIDVLLGGAWNRTWQTGDNTDTPEAIAGLNLKHRLSEKLKFQNSLTFFQNVTDRSEYRVIMDATFSVDVTKRVGVFITIGDRFNNDPYHSSRRNDFLFTTGMKWNFGRKAR
jgi:putative salt-induced outer membrane protein